MGGTKAERQARRAQRWLLSTCRIEFVSDEAFALLIRRLDARMRAILQVTPLIALSLAGWAANIVISWHGDLEKHQQRYAAWTLPAYGFIELALLLAGVLTGRAERHIGETLPRRVSRGAAIPLQLVLGPVRLTYLAVGALLQGVLAVVLLAATHGWFPWVYLVAYVCTCGFTAVGLRRAATRPTLAFDSSSLAIDERLRSEAAFQATSALFLLTVATLPGILAIRDPHWLSLAGLLLGVPVFLLYAWAGLSRPWQAPRPRGVPSGPLDENPYAQR